MNAVPWAWLEEPDVVPDAHRAQTHVHVRKRDGEQADERPFHVPAIEAARAVIRDLASRLFRQLVEKPTGDVPHRMAAERVTGEKHDVHGEHDRTKTNSEVPTPIRCFEPH